MAQVEELKVKLSADVEDFQSGMNKSMQGIGSKMQATGAIMTAVGAGITASMVGIVKAGADWSAQVEGQKFLYNNLDKQVQNSIALNSENAEAIGLTAQQYKNGATDISTYYKNMGLTADATAMLSGKTMDLVADLGAVKDVPFDETLRDFKSALMGNYEAVDKYGISLSASTLENSEFVKSLGKSWSQLSDNEKMMATYEEITRQGASAQGLAKQEAEGFGMKMKLLKQQIAETVGEIGSNLLPVLEPLVQKFSDVARSVSEWVQENPKLVQGILVVVGGLGALMLILGPIIALMGTLALSGVVLSASFLPITLTVLGVVAAIGVLIAIGLTLYNHWDELVAKASELKTELVNKFNEIKDEVVQAVTGLKDKAIEIFNTLKSTATNIWNAIKSSASSIWNGIKTTIVNLVEGAKNGVVTTFNTVKSEIERIWNSVMSFLRGINLFSIGADMIRGLVNGIKSMASSVVNAISSTVTNAINSAKKLLGINSPSKLFKKFGAWTSEGLAIGLESGTERVLSATKGISHTVIDGYTENTNRGIANNSNPQGKGELVLKIENFYNNTDKDIETLASDLSYYLKRKAII
ncbi:MAG: phage tail tape measure protein [Paraclostridium sp.]